MNRTTTDSSDQNAGFSSGQKAACRSLLMIAFAALCLTGGVAQANSNSFVCHHPDVKGGWGAFDVGCDADQFGDTSRIEYIYPKFVFDRRSTDSTVWPEYFTNMNAIIRQVAHDYYIQRVPDAKPLELEAWTRAAVAIGAHESMLSHYRISADGRYKLMTGDHLISHGVMQVNQKYHANKVLDSSFDLVGNIVGALDTYFIEWNRAVQQKCFVASLGKHPTQEFMLVSRARSAYSAYNGGPGQLCRYLDHHSRFKEHDDHFYMMYRDQPWLEYVTDRNRPSPVNTKCIIGGDDLCALAASDRKGYIQSRPLVLADGKTCLTTDGRNYTCATDMRVFSCLAKVSLGVLDSHPLKMSKLPEGANITTVRDRDPLCMKAVKGLFPVGSMIVAQKKIALRTSVDGSPVAVTRPGATYQILDYDVRLGGKSERYYQIKTSAGHEGWIFAGTDADQASFVVAAALPSTPQPTPKAVHAAPEKASDIKPAQVSGPAAVKPATTAKSASDGWDDGEISPEIFPVLGSIIEITKEGGIGLRASVDEPETTPVIDQVLQGARFTVEDVEMRGSENRIYLKISQGAKTGWIYGGRTFPQESVTQWIKLWK